MENSKINEGLESLNRIKLLMSYRNNMTLTENINEQSKTQQVVTGMGVGATLGSVAPGVGTAVGAGIGAGLGALTGYFLNMASSPTKDKVKKTFDACITNKTTPTLDEEVLDGYSIELRDAILGVGTDEEKIKEVLDKIPTIVDFCGLVKSYKDMGNDLYEDLDGEFETQTEWQNYFIIPLLPLIRKIETPKTKNDNLTPFKSFIKNDWGSEFKGNETFGIEGDLYYVIDEKKDRFNYKLEGDKFIFVQ